MAKFTYKWDHMKEAILRLRGQILRLLLASSVMNNVKRSTLLGYRSEIHRLLRWQQVMSTCDLASGRIVVPEQLREPPAIHMSDEEAFFHIGSTFTKELYFSFMVAHGGFCSIPFNKTRAALRFAQLMAGQTDLWAASDAAKAAEKSALRMGQLKLKHGKKRGTLTRAMVVELLQYAEKSNPAMARAMQIQMGAGLRIHELIAIQTEHVTATGVLILDQKRARANATSSSVVSRALKDLTHWTEGRRALHELTALAATRKAEGEQLIFPRKAFTIKQYNRMIQTAARDLAWSDSVYFDGSHVLRHAGVGIATKKLIAAHSLERVADILLMSPQMILHYALSNEERSLKVTIPSFLRLASTTVSTTGLSDSEEDSDSESDEETDRELRMDVVRMASAQRVPDATAREIASVPQHTTAPANSRAPAPRTGAVKPTKKRLREIEMEASAERRAEAAEREARTTARRALRHEERTRAGLDAGPI